MSNRRLLLAGSLFAASVLMLVLPVGAEASMTYYCNGLANPGLTTGDDFWEGWDSVNDVRSGLEGADVMYGDSIDNGDFYGVADTLCGNEGQDEIHGMDGGDWINGGQNRDQLTGRDGADEIHGGSEPDTLSGEDGADDIFGDLGADTINGYAGDDVLSGNEDNDTIRGNAGDDVANGNGGSADDCVAETENGCEI